MKATLATLALALALGVPAAAQQYAAAGEYRTCSPAQTRQGIEAVAAACGTLLPPTLVSPIGSSADLSQALSARDAFRTEVDAYGACVTSFINSYRRPGADANSSAPDQAACAHAWAEDAVTKSVMEVGRACIDYSNRTMTDPNLPDWTGNCYPDFGSGRG